MAYKLFEQKKSIAGVREFLRTASNRPWTTTTVRTLLSNEAYCGVSIYSGMRNETAHEAIVDRELWESVQAHVAKPILSRAPRATDSFPYYLRGRVRCPHCDCNYTNYCVPRPGYRVNYYACLSDMKRLTPCPVKRINARALHEAILHEISHAATHRTVMHRLVAQSESWLKPTDELTKKRGAIGKKKQFVEMQINNITTAIGEGRALTTLLTTLERLERELGEIKTELCQLDEEIAASTVQRPTAEQVQAVWGRFMEVWPELTDEEKTELLGSLVKDIEVKEKDRVSLLLASTAEIHGRTLETTCINGAGTGLEPVTFGL